MFTQNEYAMIRVNQDAHDSAYREAEKLRLLRRSGLLKHSRLAVVAYRGAGFLGRALVAFGKRLERMEAAEKPELKSVGLSPD